MTDLPSELRTLVTRYGTRVLDDPDGLRATLDDFLDEGSTPPGDINLLVDAVRFGSLDRLTTLLNEGANPAAALADVSAALAERRGGDAGSAYWACAVLGYAANLLPAELVPGSRPSSPSAFPSSTTATGSTSAPVSAANGFPDGFGRGGAPSHDSFSYGASAADRPVRTEAEPGSTWARVRRDPRRVMIPIVVLAIALVAAGVWVAIARHDSGRGMPSNPILSSLDTMNTDELAPTHNLIPISSCKAMSSSDVACTNPYDEIDAADFQTFHSLKALYTAYVAKVQKLEKKPFATIENQQDCLPSSYHGEVGWNHAKAHPKNYDVQDILKHPYTENQISGRVYCTLTGQQLTIVWTDDPNMLLGVVEGSHESTWPWWYRIHHGINLGKAGMGDSMP